MPSPEVSLHSPPRYPAAEFVRSPFLRGKNSVLLDRRCPLLASVLSYDPRPRIAVHLLPAHKFHHRLHPRLESQGKPSALIHRTPLQCPPPFRDPLADRRGPDLLLFDMKGWEIPA